MNGHNFHHRGRISLIRLGGTALALALLVYLLSRQGWGEIAMVVRQISLGRFALAFGLTVLSRLAISGRWHVLLRSAGLEISFIKSASLTFAGLFASNFLPTTVGGDVVRLGGAMRQNYNRPVCVASMVVDRLVGMAGMAMALPFIFPAILKGTSLGGEPFLIGVPILSSLDPSPTSRAGKLFGKVIKPIRRVLEALSFWVRHPHSLLSALLFTWIHMLLLFATLWMLLDPMGEQVSFWLIAGMWSLTYFITLLPVSINGLGVQEISMTFLFTNVGGISEPSALTLAFLIRILQMFASLPGALYIPDILAGREHQPAGPGIDLP